MVACREGKYALVEKLLERGALLTDTDLVSSEFLVKYYSLGTECITVELKGNCLKKVWRQVVGGQISFVIIDHVKRFFDFRFLIDTG